MAQQQRSTEPRRIEPVYVEEPHQLQDYADMLHRVAEDHRTVIVRRRGTAYAAIISLEHLQLLQDALDRREAETLADGMDWSRLGHAAPAAEWLEGDEPKPF